MVSQWLWRYWRCPRTLEGAAREFLRSRSGLMFVIAHHRSWDESSILAWKRQIGRTFGLTSKLEPHPVHGYHTPWRKDWAERLISDKVLQEVMLPDFVWQPGWNRELLAEAGPDPQLAAERILQRVIRICREQAKGV